MTCFERYTIYISEMRCAILTEDEIDRQPGKPQLVTAIRPCMTTGLPFSVYVVGCAFTVAVSVYQTGQANRYSNPRPSAVQIFILPTTITFLILIFL